MPKLKICPACKNENENIRVECAFCKYPFEGTEKEKAIHIGQFINKKSVLTDTDNAILRSQQILFAIAGINTIFLIILFLNSTNIPASSFVLPVFIIILFLTCAFLIKKNPLVFIAIPLAVLLTLYGVNYLYDPSSLLRGLLLKIIIVGSLIYSLYLIVSSNKFKKSHNIDD